VEGEQQKRKNLSGLHLIKSLTKRGRKGLGQERYTSSLGKNKKKAWKEEIKCYNLDAKYGPDTLIDSSHSGKRGPLCGKKKRRQQSIIKELGTNLIQERGSQVESRRGKSVPLSTIGFQEGWGMKRDRDDEKL